MDSILRPFKNWLRNCHMKACLLLHMKTNKKRQISCATEQTDQCLSFSLPSSLWFLNSNGKNKVNIWPTDWGAISQRWPLCSPNRIKNIMNTRKVKRHRNSDIKTGTENHNRTTALDGQYWRSLTFTAPTSPSNVEVVQITWLVGCSVRIITI